MKGDKFDVGFIEDSLFMLQHLVSAENHAIESFSSSKKKIWSDVNKVIRRMRSKYLYRIVKEENEQGYCLTKHLLASAQGLKELANRYIEDGDAELSKECFEDSQTLEKIIMIINDVDKKGGKK